MNGFQPSQHLASAATPSGAARKPARQLAARLLQLAVLGVLLYVASALLVTIGVIVAVGAIAWSAALAYETLSQRRRRVARVVVHRAVPAFRFAGRGATIASIK